MSAGSGAPQDRTYIACLVRHTPAIKSIFYLPLSLVTHMFDMLAIVTKLVYFSFADFP